MSAQQQRAKRETERTELEAAKKIQRVWRGRRDIAERRLLWRIEWDNQYGQLFARRSAKALNEVTGAIRLFLGFYDRTWSLGKGRTRIGPYHLADDLERLKILVQALLLDDCSSIFDIEAIDIPGFYTFHRLIAILLSTIPRLPSFTAESLQLVLKILHFIAGVPAVALSSVESISFSPAPLISPTYYSSLSHVTRSLGSNQHPELPMLLLKCIIGPFSAFIPPRLHYPSPSRITVYKAFARLYLTTPNLTELLGLEFVESLALRLDIGTLSDAILQSLEEDSQIHFQDGGCLDQLPSEEGKKLSEGEKLWLFAYVVFFYRRRSVKVSPHTNKDGHGYVKCVTLLLGSLARSVALGLGAGDHGIGGSGLRTDSPISGDHDDNSDFGGDDHSFKSPFSPFIKEQLYSLIEQPSVLSILSGIPSFTEFSGQPVRQAGDVEAQLLASYALTLLLVFPRKRQELRMWLYLASTADGVPVLNYLWQAVKRSRLFVDVSADVGAAVDSLKGIRRLQHSPGSGRRGSSPGPVQWAYHQNRMGNQTNEDTSQDDRDWRVILLFLELYSFLLIVMDDDDFFNAGRTGLGTSCKGSSGGEGSRARESAPPLMDVKDLTLFLKNMAFAMYWYASEIIKQGQTSNAIAVSARSNLGKLDIVTEELEVAGVSGMHYHYVKGLMTNLLRMLYLRE